MKWLVTALCALLLSVQSASAAITMISTASGNIDATGTWSVIDTTDANAFVNSETANTALTTSFQVSSTFIPLSTTVISGIGVKIASVAAAPTGTITIQLFDVTMSSVACANTVNVSDLPSASAATAEGGWLIVTCSGGNYTVIGDVMEIRALTSSAAQVNLFSLATTNWSRLLITTATQANGPAAGDSFLTWGQLTGAGTHNAFTVTVNTTVNIAYGNVANTLVAPSVAIGQFGTLAYATAGATNYTMEIMGPVVIYSGGTYNQGTSGTPIPATSTAKVLLQTTVEGDTGFNMRNGSTFSANGVARTTGKNIVKTLLTATATGASTSTLTVQDDTGWLSGDTIALSGTSSAGTQDATGTLTSNATASTLPLTGAVANTHTASGFSYTSTHTGNAYAMNLYPAVILISRNVVIQGGGASIPAYIYGQPNSNIAMAWTEFQFIGGTAASKRGVEVDTGPSGAFSLTYSSFFNCFDNGLFLAPLNASFGGPSAGSPVLVQHNVMYNCASNAGNGVTVNAQTANPFWVIDDLTVMKTGVNFPGYGIKLSSIVGQFTNITVSGSGNNGGQAAIFLPALSDKAGTLGGGINAFGPLFLNSNFGTSSLSIGGTGTISGIYSWHDTPITIQTGSNITIDPYYAMGTTWGTYDLTSSVITRRNGVVSSDITTNSPALVADANMTSVIDDNMELCPNSSINGFFAASPCTAQSISLNNDYTTGPSLSLGTYIGRNTSLLGSAEYPLQKGQLGYSKWGYALNDCAACAVKHAAFLYGGTLTYDTAIFHSVGYSTRMTPYVATFNGWIAGTLLTVTSNVTGGATPYMNPGWPLYTAASGFVPGTSATITNTGSGTGIAGTYSITVPQTVASSGAPAVFQQYQTFDGTLPRLQSAPMTQGVKVAAASGNPVTECVFVRLSSSGDAAPLWGGSAVNYTGDAPRLINRQNPAMGVASDTVIATFSGSSVGAWQQLCGTTGAAATDGEFEFVVDCDQTYTSNAGGWINVADWSASGGAVNPNGSQQFWFNGVPFDSSVPLGGSGGGGSSGGAGIGSGAAIGPGGRMPIGP